MIHFFGHHSHKERIHKAGRKRKVSRTYKRVYALSQQMSRAVQVNFVRGVKTFKNRVSEAAVYNAWKSGDYQKIMQVIPWDKLPEDMEGIVNPLEKTMVKTGKNVIESLPAPIQEEFRFDTKNPEIRNYLSNRTGELVTDISKNTQAIIQNAVTRSFDQALHPSDVAGMIKGSIGLYPRLENAVENYRQGLLRAKTPLSQGRVAFLVDKYNDRLLNYRAMMIARTETRNATNTGQLNIWQQAAEQGLIDPHTAKKVWIVDGNPCEICDPMDGKKIGLYEYWTLSNGLVVDTPSESHPHCMCGMEIDYGDSEKNLAADQVRDENYSQDAGDDDV